MIASTRKFIRSGFFQTISIVSPSNPLRTARLDFWGAVGLVCVIGTLAKIAQTLLIK
jgi:hypothetical protein